VRVRFTPNARANLDAIREYIAADNPRAARRLVTRVRGAALALSSFPARGRPGRAAGTRELVVSGTPYVVVYRIEDSVVAVLAVMHGAMDRPPGTPWTGED
jgi:toxin ParE1/3/4